MKRIILAALVGVLVSMVTPVWGADQKGGPTVLGTGNRSCGYWVEARRQTDSSSAYINSAWVHGFISAYNVFVPPGGNVAKRTNVPGREAWLDNYCSKNPLDAIAIAAAMLVQYLK